MKKTVLLIVLFLSVIYVFPQGPVISNFLPIQGAAGSLVNISGSGFDASTAGNIVYFGAVRAQVISATPNSLSVIVPSGATYQPISVTVNGLIAYSAKPFIYTFSSGGDILVPAFLQSQNFTTGSHPNEIAVADFDGDGKPDIATPNNYSSSEGTISILRNVSIPGQIDFAPAQDIATGAAAYAIATADFDGDGKIDIVASSIAESNIAVFKNTSTPGNISFESRISFATGNSPYGIATADFNNDGKVDIAVVNNLEASISVFSNLSSNGNISFAYRVNYGTGLYPDCIATGDIDGDGNVDIVIGTEQSKMSVLRNVSSIFALSFDPGISYTTSNKVTGISIGDLNADGRPDIAVSIYNTGTSTQSRIYENASSAGNIAFAAALTSINTDPGCLGITMNDINGDGKPDVLVQSDVMNIAQNTGTGSTLLFSLPVVKLYSYGLNHAVIVDLDGDGKNDLAGSRFGSNTVLVFKNRLKQPYITGFSPLTAAEGAQVTISGGNFTGSTAVSFGGAPAQSFTINGNTIIATLDTGASGAVTITTPEGAASKDGFIFNGPPKIYSFSPTAAEYGSLVKIRGANFNNVTTVSFGSVPVLSFTVDSTSLISAYVGVGASGSVKVSKQDTSASLAGFTYLPRPKIINAFPLKIADGKTVTVTGINFQGVTNVSFGNVSARSFTIVSKDTLRVVVDTGASGAMIISSPFGSDTLVGFTFIPRPVITTFTPGQCFAGTQLVIYGANFNDITGVFIGNADYTTLYNRVSSSQLIINLTSVLPGPAEIRIITQGGTTVNPGPDCFRAPANIRVFPLFANSGDTVCITGYSLYGTTNISFGGSAARSFVYHNSGWITAVVNQGSTGTVTVTNPAGAGSYIGGNSDYEFTFVRVPKITSFFPASGAAGTTVNIRGKNFDALAANNLVRFGNIQAAVVYADSNNLKVIVPAGASYGPVSVTNLPLKLTAYYDVPFRVTFPSDSTAFSHNSFTGETLISNSFKPGVIVIGDMDGDGKNDIVAANKSAGSIAVLRNISMNGQFLFAPPVNYLSGFANEIIDLSDMNGDGKLDIITFIENNEVNILLNNSTPGNLSFATRFTVPGSLYISNFLITDFNHDGKPDILINNNTTLSNQSSSIMTPLYKNNSINGNLSFEIAGQLFIKPASGSSLNSQNGLLTGAIVAADFDRNGLVDVVMGSTGDSMFKFVNPGNYNRIDLSVTATCNSYGVGCEKSNPVVADFDGDQLADLITNCHINQNMGGFIFKAIYNGDMKWCYGATDFNGDGKPDIFKMQINSTHDSIKLVLGQNTSSAGTISFANNFEYVMDTLTAAVYINVGDIDGDGKADILLSNNKRNRISVLRNIIVKKEAARVCISSAANFTSNLSGSFYQWQVSTDGTNFTNITADANYIGVTSSTLSLTNIPVSLGGNSYRCIVDGLSSNVYKIILGNTWTGSVSNAWENPANWSCGVVPDQYTNVVINNGPVVINSNVTINSLAINPGVSFSVNAGYQLIVLH